MADRDSPSYGELLERAKSLAATRAVEAEA